MSNFLTYRYLLAFILSASSAALLIAYTMQYFFGFLPCKFCYFERYIYFTLIMLSFLGLYLNHEFKRWFIRGLGLVLAAGIAINSYHIAIEHKWAVLDSTCISDLSNHKSFEDFKLALEGKELVACDQPTAFFLGLSLATWNLLYLLVLSYVFTHYLRRGNHAA